MEKSTFVSRLVHGRLWQLVDAVIAAIFFTIVGMPLYILLRFRKSCAKTESIYNLMILPAGVSVEYLDTKFGNIQLQLKEEHGEGYFENSVYGMFPMPRRTRRIRWADKIDVLEFHPFLGLFYYTTAVYMTFRLTFVCIFEKITHLRATDGHYLGLIGLMISRFAKVQYCISVQTDYEKYDSISGGESRPKILGSAVLAEKLERYTLSRAHLVYTLSEYLGHYCKKRGVSVERIRIVRHAIDDTRLKVSTELIEEVRLKLDVPDGPKMLYVGRLHKEKGILKLVPIVREIRRLGVNVTAIVAGHGPHRDALEQEISDAGIQDAFKLLGARSSEEVACLLNLCQSMFCPISGFALIEAALTGKAAVVAYDVEWHRELIVDGINGFLVPEDAAAEAAQRVVRILNDQTLQKSLATKLQEDAIKVHRVPEAYKYRRDFYEELRTISAP